MDGWYKFKRPGQTESTGPPLFFFFLDSNFVLKNYKSFYVLELEQFLFILIQLYNSCVVVGNKKEKENPEAQAFPQQASIHQNRKNLLSRDPTLSDTISKPAVLHV